MFADEGKKPAIGGHRLKTCGFSGLRRDTGNHFSALVTLVFEK
jgi:hypothetical protein